MKFNFFKLFLKKKKKMNKYLKKQLVVNGFGKLATELEKISEEDSEKVALGVQLVFENWDCAPNGGIIFDIIDYLNNKSNIHKEELKS